MPGLSARLAPASVAADDHVKKSRQYQRVQYGIDLSMRNVTKDTKSLGVSVRKQRRAALGSGELG